MRLRRGQGGQSFGMSSHEDGTVANPDRTHIDDDPTQHDRDEDVHETHDRLWPAAAKEIKQPVRDVD